MYLRYKRRYLRVPLRARVIVLDDHQYAFLRSGTISEGGMFIHCPKQLWPVGKELKLHIKSSDMASPLLTHGEIVNFVDSDESGFCIRFTDLGMEERLLIKNYVEYDYFEDALEKEGSSDDIFISLYKEMNK